MFTGIVEELGQVVSMTHHAGSARVELKAEIVTDDVTLGASISVNGCCLTMVSFDESGFVVGMVPETMHRTTLSNLTPGDLVNLERPVRLSDRLGGHLVQGHVDGTARVCEVLALPDGSRELIVEMAQELRRYVIQKGSIALDGVSLTVASQRDGCVGVAVIPHTLAVTTLGRRVVGDDVNVEVDLVAKYVESLVRSEK